MLSVFLRTHAACSLGREGALSALTPSEGDRFAACKCLDLIGARLACGVARKPLFAGLEELVGPTVVEVLSDTFLAAELRDAVFAAQAIEHNADLLLG